MLTKSKDKNEKVWERKGKCKELNRTVLGASEPVMKARRKYVKQNIDYLNTQ